ncbi:MAG TPA: FG-GAP-like repeat-containing protein, partial [Tepidisphaeraceae bacterium]|nr:FG-GAP-like repeat-containing protein [Tepidisphaeraceae bacterium]
IDGDNQPTGLIVANSGYGGTVDYLPGNGNGTFGYAQQVQVVNSTTYAAVQNTVQGDLVAVADLTGDGNPDLVVKYRIGYTTNYEVAILQGTGNGTFTRQFTVNNATAYQVFLAVGQDPKAFAVGDVNGDGMPDLLVANYSTYSDVRVLLNQGNGAFGAGVTYATGFDPDSIALADLSGDGQLDIITANRNEQSLTVLQGYGNGTFQPAQQFPLGLTSFPVFVGAGDINGDGKPDLVALNALAPNYSISILQNTTFEVFFTNVTDNTLTVTGTPGNDTISATALGQFFTVTENGVTSQQFPVVGITTMNVLGEDGNDSISIGPGIDGGIVAGGVSTTDPGTGADTVIAGNNETVYGGAAGDSMTSGDSTNVSLVGNVGADTLVAGEFNVTMLGGAGGDSLMGGPGLDLLLGGGGPDTIVAGIGNNTLVGGAGADSLTGGTGSDLLSGGAGPDTLVAIPANTLTANASTLLGGLGNDSMVFVGIDWVVGGGGNDTLAEQLDPYS